MASLPVAQAFKVLFDSFIIGLFWFKTKGLGTQFLDNHSGSSGINGNRRGGNGNIDKGFFIILTSLLFSSFVSFAVKGLTELIFFVVIKYFRHNLVGLKGFGCG
jgi:hypothetical protein